ncbi:MAG TPA: PLP-dependent aspartate aminotransferase family protein [Gammaproteobacteria bacterium]
MKKETRVNHPPEVRPPAGNRSLVEPIYRSVKFTYPSIEASLSPEAKELGFDYTRDSNPTTRALELLAAELQERDDGICTATGMAAIWLAILGNIRSGERILLFLESYRPTRVAVRRMLARFGITHALVSLRDTEAIERELAREDTKLLLFESPTNPMLQVPDIAWLVERARAHGVISVLDNTFAGLHNHGGFDVDYYVHSLTKYAGGHGDAMGGIVIGEKKKIKALRPQAVNLGACMDPDVAFLMLRGLKTYYLRYERHSQNAQAIAEFLAKRPEVERVYYPGLASDPNHALARRQMRDFGGVVTFDLKGADRAKTWAFIDALEIFATTASLGSTESLVCPVQLYLGSDLSAEEQRRAGIGESTVRLAVGIEHVDDLVADLAQAFAKTFGA